MHEKKSRAVLYEMLEAGLVFLQEVPKSLDHAAAKTIFLWYVDVSMTCQILLINAYKTMNNIKHQEKSQYDRFAVLLEKTSRTDVISGEASLSEHETQNLQKFKHILRQLNDSQVRIADMIMLLRDW
jgi:hypothetical protein